MTVLLAVTDDDEPNYSSSIFVALTVDMTSTRQQSRRYTAAGALLWFASALTRLTCTS